MNPKHLVPISVPGAEFLWTDKYTRALADYKFLSTTVSIPKTGPFSTNMSRILQAN